MYSNFSVITPQVLPKKADWIKQRVTTFDPHNNKVITEDGEEISYEFLVVSLGIQLNYNEVGSLALRYSNMSEVTAITVLFPEIM